MDPFETHEDAQGLTEEQRRWEDAHWAELAMIAEYETWLAEQAVAGDCYGADGE